MRLYLVRHGDALSAAEDPERPLSPRGRDDARRMAEALGRAGVRVREIRHSGKARAARTAEILAKHVGLAEPVAAPGLAPNAPVEPLVDEIETRTADLMIVGHLPFLALLASRLLAGDTVVVLVEFESAAASCLERDLRGVWSLVWLLPPSLVQ